MAEKSGADIFFGDETTVRSDYHSGTIWAPRGKTPVVKTTGARHKVNLIYAITPRAEMKFMATEKNINAEPFVEFLKRLLTRAEKPIFLILDNSFSFYQFLIANAAN